MIVLVLQGNLITRIYQTHLGMSLTGLRNTALEQKKLECTNGTRLIRVPRTPSLSYINFNTFTTTPITYIGDVKII